MDAFTCDWGNENNWWCPPPYLGPRLIQHARLTNAYGTLVVLQWPSAPYWPLLFPDGASTSYFINGLLILQNSGALTCPGRAGANLFKGVPNTNMLAVRIDFRLIAKGAKVSK